MVAHELPILRQVAHRAAPSIRKQAPAAAAGSRSSLARFAAPALLLAAVGTHVHT
jgi:hypothetical protein